ncbi:protein GrpE-like [Hylaeus volcanicus]|uniref:protein GrpE-like n=1 Tax=Hylaeus volcanicus TaxID=313075 RepID=UPI0023B86281|nr:protein GrpE-like [Hylaeus volcanicus]
MCTAVLLGRRMIRLPLNYLGYSFHISRCTHKMWVPSMNQCHSHYRVRRFVTEKPGSIPSVNKVTAEDVVSSSESDSKKIHDDNSDKFKLKTEQANDVAVTKNVTIEHLQDRILRILAENENIIQRHTEELKKAKLYSISKFAEGLLNVCDNLELAIQHATSESFMETNPLVQGVTLTLESLKNLLENFNIHSYESLNTVFCPSKHSVVHEVEDPLKPKGTIVEVIKKGYIIKDRVLRPASVVTSK